MDLNRPRVVLVSGLLALLLLVELAIPLFGLSLYKLLLLCGMLLVNMRLHHFSFSPFPFTQLSLSIYARLLRCRHMLLLVERL
jgi:hypothetical protein